MLPSFAFPRTMAAKVPEAPGAQQMQTALRGNGLKRRCDSITVDDGHAIALPAKKTKPLSYSNPQQVVYVKVGPDESYQIFAVYKNVLCEHSPVFAAKFANGQNRMRLEDPSHFTFRMLLEWFSRQQVEFSPINGAPNDLLSLAKLWALGADLVIPEVQNQVLLQVHWILGQPIDNIKDLMGFIVYVDYMAAEKETPLRNLAVEMVAHGFRKNVFGCFINLEDMPKRFRGEVAGKLRDFRHQIFF